MLDLKFIKENQELVARNCQHRCSKVNLERLLALEQDRREVSKTIDDQRAKRNSVSKNKPSQKDIELMRCLGEEIKKLEAIEQNLDMQIKEELYRIPNMTHPDSPIGQESDFKVIFVNKEPTAFNFEPKNHEELMTNLDLIDFERGAKVTGSKFYFCKGELVRLDQALINYGLDVASKHGYQLLETPDLVKTEIMEGSGYNPRGAEKQTYEVKDTDLDLIGTAEITVLGYHANEVIDLSKGAKKYVALSHCFRKEAGSYGQTSRGLFRVHQFTKLEMFIFCVPTESETYHQELLDIEKEIVEGLDLPYRVIDIATADLGGPAYRKYDLEAWMTTKGDKDHQGGYGEITSTSNCTDYQARRLNIKYKNPEGKKEFVHTLNGTAVVLSRFPLAIIENHQQVDGSIVIPKILKKYCGFDKIEPKL